MVDLIDTYQYEDNQVNDVDAFAREPYILHFKPRNTGQFHDKAAGSYVVQCFCYDLALVAVMPVSSLVCLSNVWIVSFFEDD